MILHLVNLTNTGTWRQSLEELLPVGPIHVRVKLPGGVRGEKTRLLVSGQKVPNRKNNDWCSFEIKSILDHEVVVIT
jgi:hypothetical protein